MGKVLFISNIVKKVGPFSIASIIASKECGLKFYMAGNWSTAKDVQIINDEKEYNITIYDIMLSRSPFSIFTNYKAYKELESIVKNENIDYIHCNTPVGGLLGRILGKKFSNIKVIYHVHGFHFYKGSPTFNWIFIYPIEKLLAKWTDAIITINKEDYSIAQKFHLRKNGKVYYVPGVGINLEFYRKSYSNRNSIRKIKREQLGINDSDCMIISVGELNKNKNNETIIKAIGSLKKKNFKYFLCGVGREKEKLVKLSENYGIQDQVKFLGYRDDINELYIASDIFVLPSFREGLSRSLMEAMASGLPCIVSDIRGNRDLIDNKGGFLSNPHDIDCFAEKIQELYNEQNTCESFGKYNRSKIEKFDTSIVIKSISRIYKEVFDL